MAQGERLADGGGIEEGLVGGKMAVVDGGLGGRQRGDGKAGHGVGLGLAQRDEQQLGAVEISAMGGGEEAAAGGAAGQDVAGGGSIEPIGAQQLEKELGTEFVRGIGEEGAEGVETEADADGAVGLGLDQLLAQGLEEGGIEPLDRLKVGDGGVDGLVGRRLELAEEGQQPVAHLVAAVEERGVGDVFDMGEALLEGVAVDLGPAEGEQGAHHRALHGQDAMEAGEAGAAQKVDEEGFGGVVAVVCGEDSGVAMEGAELAKPVVAELAGSVLNAQPM